MNLLKELSVKETELLKDIGINIEDRNYDKEERKKVALNVEEFIISHSTKNNDISILQDKYSNIIYKLI